jgi:26S proteasome regulatory subunit T3
MRGRAGRRPANSTRRVCFCCPASSKPVVVCGAFTCLPAQEIKRIQAVPLVIGQFMEMIDSNYGIVSSTTGSTYHVRILSTLDKEKLKPNTSIALHRHAHSVVEILPPEADSSVQMLQMTERPDVTYEVSGP